MTVLYRVSYARQALAAWWKQNIFGGVGPGGLMARWVILQPGRDPAIPNSYQPHAHNTIINLLAETGLFGLAALGLAGWQIWRQWPTWGRWQQAALVAIAVYCMFDHALYFVGPLIVTAIVLGVANDESHRHTKAEV
jgi:O-antigen ligase